MNRFAESQLWGNSFGEQLWGTTLGSSAGEQLWLAALGSGFGQLSGPALRQLRAGVLGSFFGTRLSVATLWGTTLGSSAGEQLWLAALGSGFGQLSGPALRQLRAGVLGSFFGTRLSVATLKSSFGEQLWRATLRLCSSIDEQLL